MTLSYNLSSFDKYDYLINLNIIQQDFNLK